MNLREEFGDLDIYVFDQLLRGRIVSASAAGETSPKLADLPGAREGGPVRVFDAGCGAGRNLVYFLRHGYDVIGNDASPDAIAKVRALAASLAPGRAHDFRHEAIEDTSFPEASADVVFASAVLHFARDPAHFEAMLRAMWRVLKPGGLFFARLASTIGIEDQVRALANGPGAPVTEASEGGRYRLPDGSVRYLVDAAMLIEWTGRLGGELIDPLKTTVVHNQRAMTTWVARRR